jgi:hypothetical protein
LSYYQKKRQFNKAVAKLLVAGVSQRDCGRILKLNKKTVVNKFIFIVLGLLLQFYYYTIIKNVNY